MFLLTAGRKVDYSALETVVVYLIFLITYKRGLLHVRGVCPVEQVNWIMSVPCVLLSASTLIPGMHRIVCSTEEMSSYSKNGHPMIQHRGILSSLFVLHVTDMIGNVHATLGSTEVGVPTMARDMALCKAVESADLITRHL